MTQGAWAPRRPPAHTGIGYQEEGDWDLWYAVPVLQDAHGGLFAEAFGAFSTICFRTALAAFLRRPPPVGESAW